MSVGVSKASSGETTSLIKLARQAMGEIDEEQEAKQARQRQDDKAEEVVHKEHIEVVQGTATLLKLNWYGCQSERNNTCEGGLQGAREAEGEREQRGAGHISLTCHDCLGRFDSFLYFRDSEAVHNHTTLLALLQHPASRAARDCV